LKIRDREPKWGVAVLIQRLATGQIRQVRDGYTGAAGSCAPGSMSGTARRWPPNRGTTEPRAPGNKWRSARWNPSGT